MKSKGIKKVKDKVKILPIELSDIAHKNILDHQTAFAESTGGKMSRKKVALKIIENATI